jgi:hypothetical protein
MKKMDISGGFLKNSSARFCGIPTKGWMRPSF